MVIENSENIHTFRLNERNEGLVRGRGTAAAVALGRIAVKLKQSCPKGDYK